VSIQNYSIRLRLRALYDLNRESVRLAELVGDSIALDWKDKIKDALASLATFPQKYAVAQEDGLREREVRVMLFRRTSNGPAWRIFYTIEKPPLGLDGFVVHVRHIRHAASPLTKFDQDDLLTDA
jgi:plasmid stabilization system protein ParE